MYIVPFIIVSLIEHLMVIASNIAITMLKMAGKGDSIAACAACAAATSIVADADAGACCATDFAVHFDEL
jgi:hypothetical protein